MAFPSGPAVQSSYMKNLFAAFEERGLRERIASRDPELAEEIDAAGRLSWLPLELNVRTVDLLCDLLGEAEGLRVLAECVHGQFGTPLWKQFIGGGLRLLGREPAGLGRWLPRAFSVVFRGCGQWDVECRGPGELSVRLREIPESIISQRRWLQSLGAGMNALFLLCDTPGHSALVAVDEGIREARFRLRW